MLFLKMAAKSYFCIYNKALFFERFVEKKETLQGLLYLKRKIIYLSKTYAELIVVAYLVILKERENEHVQNKQYCRNILKSLSYETMYVRHVKQCICNFLISVLEVEVKLNVINNR